jgi:hypothetical protein
VLAVVVFQVGQEPLVLRRTGIASISMTVGLSQHPYEDRPERPVLLAVDQQLGEDAALRVAPELSDPVGALEVGEHEDAEQLGAGSGTERVETLPQTPLEFVRSHGERA